jgi:glycosyltransferase involved in cell wall biosynthesis
MISLCITTYRRDSLLFESFRQVLNDERISEIVIVDDFSPPHFMEAIQAFCQHPKIKIYRNAKNLGCYRNKAEAVRKASNEWVYLLDSDNVITPECIDVLYRYNVSTGWKRNTILAPEFAWPTFDYRGFSGVTLSRENVRNYVPLKRFDCLINTANYFFHRDEYLRLHDAEMKAWRIETRDHINDPWTADTIYTNYNWLKAGGSIHVLPGLQYFHRTDDFKGEEGSHYVANVKKTNGLAKKIEQRLLKLR